MEDHLSLQRDLQQLETWASTQGMRFNAKKCYIKMSINTKSTHFYKLDSHILQQVPENPYLGVTPPDDLKWSNINKITKKASSTLGFLKRNLKHCPTNCRKIAYLSLVRSTLEYSSIVRDPHLQKDIDKLERVQRQAARFITGDYTLRDQGCISRKLADLQLPSL